MYGRSDNNPGSLGHSSWCNQVRSHGENVWTGLQLTRLEAGVNQRAKAKVGGGLLDDFPRWRQAESRSTCVPACGIDRLDYSISLVLIR